MSDDLDALLERLDALHAETTPGQWYAHWVDDDYCMNTHAVTTSPEEPDVGQDFRTNDHAKVVALTLLNLPQIVAHDAGRWEEDAEWIAAAHNAYPRLRDELARLREENERLQRTGRLQNRLLRLTQPQREKGCLCDRCLELLIAEKLAERKEPTS